MKNVNGQDVFSTPLVKMFDVWCFKDDGNSAKHILICVNLRHLYRSKQLTTILKRLCHCESYSFTLELETAIAKTIDEGDTYLNLQIVTGKNNFVFHSELDNLNKILKNYTGPNIVKSATEIKFQEQKKETYCAKQP